MSNAALVPPIVLALAKHPLARKYDISSLKRIGRGAASLGEGVAQAIEKQLGCIIAQGYLNCFPGDKRAPLSFLSSLFLTMNCRVRYDRALARLHWT